MVRLGLMMVLVGLLVTTAAAEIETGETATCEIDVAQGATLLCVPATFSAPLVRAPSVWQGVTQFFLFLLTSFLTPRCCHPHTPCPCVDHAVPRHAAWDTMPVVIEVVCVLPYTCGAHARERLWPTCATRRKRRCAPHAGQLLVCREGDARCASRCCRGHHQ